MTSDLDIYRSAKLLVDRHGEDEAIWVGQHHDAMLERGGAGRLRGVEADSHGDRGPAGQGPVAGGEGAVGMG